MTIILIRGNFFTVAHREYAMYVCICKAITEKQVRQAASDGARSLQDLQCGLGVATGCGQCAEDACNVLAGACTPSDGFRGTQSTGRSGASLA
ncbi:MAG: (2Fe-2S)-binding protein [Gammaproteobacteria bacterium]